MRDLRVKTGDEIMDFCKGDDLRNTQDFEKHFEQMDYFIEIIAGYNHFTDAICTASRMAAHELGKSMLLAYSDHINLPNGYLDINPWIYVEKFTCPAQALKDIECFLDRLEDKRRIIG
jgi:hypothetical protein